MFTVKKNGLKFILIALMLCLAVVFFTSGATDYLTLDGLKAQKDTFTQFYAENKGITILVYATAYILVTALSLPGAAIMTLAGGAVFGVALGTLVVSFSSTVGATCAFLVSRYLLQGSVQRKFGDKLKRFNDGIEREGAFYLFTLRLVPAFPFFMINLVMGITTIKTMTFFFVSQLGMLPGTAVYVNAGTQLSKISSLGDILSAEIIGSFILLGVFPIIAKKVIEAFKSKSSEA